MDIKQVIEHLAQPGWRIRIEQDDFSNEYILTGPTHDITGLFDELIREGWLISSPNGGCYILSDAGRAAYMRSTDELGDGKLVSPRAATETSKSRVCEECFGNGRITVTRIGNEVNIPCPECEGRGSVSETSSL